MKINIILGFVLSMLVFVFVPFSAEAQDVKGAKDYFLHGDKNSKVKVVTYTDFECPFCNRFHATLERLIDKYKKENISFSYRSFPLSQIHPDAFEAAVALECLNKVKDKKSNLEFSSIIFNNIHSTEYAGFNLDEIIKSTKVNESKFLRCMEDKKVRSSIEKLINEYTNKVAKIDRNFGTPYSVISKGLESLTIPGAQSFEVTDKIVAEFLNGKKTTSKNSFNEYERVANDAATKALLANLRANAELYYDDNNQNYKNVCSELTEYVNEYGLEYKIKISCKDTFDKFSVEAKLSDRKYFCVDSTGYAGTSNKSKGRSALKCKY